MTDQPEPQSEPIPAPQESSPAPQESSPAPQESSLAPHESSLAPHGSAPEPSASDSSQPSLSPTSEKKPPRKRSPLLIVGAVLLGVIALLAICLVAFYFVNQKANLTSFLPSSLPKTFTSDQAGITISYPKDWVAQDNGSGVTFASSSEIMQGSSTSFGEFANALEQSSGAYLAILRAPISELGLPSEVDLTSAEQILDHLITVGGLLQGVEKVEVGDVKRAKFAGFPSATSVSTFSEGDTTGNIYLASILSDEYLTLMVGISPDSGWRVNKAIIDRMLNSMTLENPALQ